MAPAALRLLAQPQPLLGTIDQTNVGRITSANIIRQFMRQLFLPQILGVHQQQATTIWHQLKSLEEALRHFRNRLQP